MWQPTAAKIADEVAQYRGGWLEQLPQRVKETLQSHLFFEFLGGLTWWVVGLMLIGMALVRLDVFQGKRSVRFCRRLAVGGLSVGLTLSVLHTYEAWASDFDFYRTMFRAVPLGFLGSPFVAVGCAALGILFTRRKPEAGPTLMLAAVGRTALSNYLLQTLIATTLFYGHGFGLFGRLNRSSLVWVVLAVWTVQIVATRVWLGFFEAGPLERLWRRLTYGAPRTTAAMAAAR
jgi:uncharacterized protein